MMHWLRAGGMRLRTALTVFIKCLSRFLRRAWVPECVLAAALLLAVGHLIR